MVDALSSGPRKKSNAGCLVPFFLVFLLVGLGVFYGIGVRPALKILSARSWPEVPCTILSSEVSSGGKNTYGIAIRYRYEFLGETLESGAYDFMVEMKSSGYDGKAATVAKFPPGASSRCWVDPADPREAVLDRDFHAGYLFGLLPLIFVAVGGGGIFFTLRPLKSKRASTAPSGRRPEAVGGRLVLKPAGGPGCRFALSLGIAAFWNGMVSIFLIVDPPSGCVILFMIPFVLVGLGLLAWTGYSLLALFNPRPELSVSRGSVALGDAFDLEWSFSGNVDRLGSLKIVLEGREEATYRRGTKTTTDKSVFATIVLHEEKTPVARAGRAAVEIPRDTMHSFAAKNNKITWWLKLSGEIPRWPDVKEDFLVDVRPLGEGA